jgi:paraquat-inducible protein B
MSGPADPDRPVPEAEVQPARRALWERVSVVWLVPLGALLIALAMAWQAYSDRGPTIEITFANGSGISAGETELRYRDIAVGQVERVGFTEGLGRVLVTVRLDEEVAAYVDDSAEFWVVRPQVTAQGVQGLNTVLSGVYIEGSWDADPGEFVTRFEGLREVPVARPDMEGTRIVLRSDDGRGLTEGAPILYRGLEVGHVGAPRIATDGITVLADAFVEAPHDRLLTDLVRFWSASGFSFNVGPQGASLDFASLSSLVRGGLAFEVVVSGGEPVPAGAAFDIYPNREAAVASVFATEEANAPRLNLTAVFEDNVAGLSTGAPVTLRGLEIGEVVDLSGTVDPQRFGDGRVRLVATLSIRLDELTMGDVSEDGAEEVREEVLDFLAQRVEEGLRARLTNASLFTGGLKVEMVQLDDPGSAAFDREAQPFPVLPTAPAEVQDVAGAAQGLIARIEALPIEDVLDNAAGFLESARALVEDGEIQRASGEVVGLVEEMRAVVGSEAVQALPEQLGGIATDLRAALADLEERQGVARVVDAVERAGRAAEEIGTAAEGVPELVERVTAVAAQAEELALQELVDEAGALVADARGLVGTEAAQALPGQLSETLGALDRAVGEAETLLSQLRAEDTVATVTAALDQAGTAAGDVSAAVEGVPALIERIDTVAAQAEGLALQELVAQADALLSDARAIFGTEAAQALPGQLGSALESLDAATTDARAVLARIESEGSVDRLNAALEAAAEAAEDVSVSVEGVPELVERLDAVAARAETLEVEALVDEVTALAGAAREVLGTEGARALPGQLGDALREVEAALAELRAGGTVENVNETLASARRAADSVAVTAEDLPALVDRTASVLGQAEAVLATLGETGRLNREAQAALREVSRAAEAVRSLARRLERNPSAVLTGR